MGGKVRTNFAPSIIKEYTEFEMLELIELQSINNFCLQSRDTSTKPTAQIHN